MADSSKRKSSRSVPAGKRQGGFAGEDRYRVLFEQAADAIFIHEPQGRFLEVNATACERLGYSREQLLRMSPVDIAPPEYVERIREITKQLGSGQPITVETVHRSSGGSLIPVEISMRIIHFEGAQAVMGIARDISGRKQAGDVPVAGASGEAVDNLENKRMEQALEQERSKLQMMLSHESLISTVAAKFNSTHPFEKNLDELLPLFGQTAALDSVVVWQLNQSKNKADIFSRWESARGVRFALAREFGRDDLPVFYDSIIKGRTLAVGPGLIGDELCNYFKFSADCALLTFPLSFGGKVKGAIRYSRANGMDWSEEEVSMFGAVSEIVTNAWERESEFQARLAAERSHTDSVQMVERATRLASIGVIAAGITHEINQPLNAIRLTSDGTLMWIERNGIELPQKIINRLSNISSHVERITRIIKHMREFWDSTDGRKSDVFDLSEAVEDAMGLVEQQLKSHGIELRRNYCSGPVMVAGDRLHVEQIAINLIVNAMQTFDAVRGEGKLLEISTRVEEDLCILEIADNGPGFSGQERERLFDMFYSTKKPGEGTGLGLAIVKRYAEELGGAVEVDSGAGEAGALFRVSIPLCDYKGKP